MTGRRRDSVGPGRPGLALLAAALLAGGCGGDDRTGTETLSDSVYVEVMARLVVLDSALSPTPESGSAGRGRMDSLRTRVLETWNVDPGRLLDYARTRGGDPERMEAVWRRVHELSDSLADAGWSPPGGSPAGAAPGDSARTPADTAGGEPVDGGGAGEASGTPPAGGAPAPARGRP